MKKILDKNVEKENNVGLDVKLDWWEKSSIADMVKFLTEDSFDTYNHMIEKSWDTLEEEIQKKLKSERVFRSNTQIAIWTLVQLRKSAWKRIKESKNQMDTNEFIKCFNSNEKWNELISKNKNKFKI